MSLSEWLLKEKSRQIQKTFQNTIGAFHQRVLGNMEGWQDLGTGSVIDIVNRDKKIIAEIKNKFNTTKGNHKPNIYDDIEHQINNKYLNYTGYYVPILTKKRFNKPFTPPDNKTGKRRLTNRRIREIDGETFYALASEEKDAIKQLYQTLPYIISDIVKSDPKKSSKILYLKFYLRKHSNNFK